MRRIWEYPENLKIREIPVQTIIILSRRVEMLI